MMGQHPAAEPAPGPGAPAGGRARRRAQRGAGCMKGAQSLPPRGRNPLPCAISLERSCEATHIMPWKIFDLPSRNLQKESLQLKNSHSWGKMHFWNFIFIAQFGRPHMAQKKLFAPARGDGGLETATLCRIRGDKHASSPRGYSPECIRWRP
jgi:hypothetical protein